MRCLGIGLRLGVKLDGYAEDCEGKRIQLACGGMQGRAVISTVMYPSLL